MLALLSVVIRLVAGDCSGELTAAEAPYAVATTTTGDASSTTFLFTVRLVFVNWVVLDCNILYLALIEPSENLLHVTFKKFELFFCFNLVYCKLQNLCFK